jgi:hypothetical protein
MAKQYFHVVDNQRLGPFSGVQVKQRAAAGAILPHHFIQEEGSPKLYEARLVPGLFDAKAAPTASSVSSVPSDGGDHGRQPSPLRPRFRNPVSSLLNSLTTLTLDNMHARVGRGELTQAAFERAGAALLTELQSAITFAETLSASTTPTGADSANTSRSGAGPQQAREAGRTGGRPPNGPVVPVAKNAGRSGGDNSSRRPSPNVSPPAAAGPAIPSALQLGAAALAGGAWGYLLARQGGIAGGHGGGDTHVHYHGTAQEFAGDSASEMASGDVLPVSHVPSSPQPQTHVMGVDSNNDGLVDTFYGDSNGDGIADMMGRDVDADGDLDHVAVDSNDDGAFDRTFKADDTAAEVEDMADAADGDLDEQDFEAADDIADDYDAGDYGDFADTGGDFGGDFDFG